MLRMNDADARTRAIGFCFATGLAPTPENLQAIVDILAEVWVQAFGEGRLAERKDMTRQERIVQMNENWIRNHPRVQDIGWGGEVPTDAMDTPGGEATEILDLPPHLGYEGLREAIAQALADSELEGEIRAERANWGMNPTSPGHSSWLDRQSADAKERGDERREQFYREHPEARPR